jgi:anti-sigma-K factor RskA
MKEMDPSEELLMERAMMEDEDLLIEVESMRQTLKKLEKLPEKDPPSDVTESVMEMASEQAAKNRQNNSFIKPVYRYAVAATLALTITAGGTWFMVDYGESASQNQQSVTSSNKTTSSVQSAGTQLSERNMQQVSTMSGTSQTEKSIKPWVDRNDIIRFDKQFSNQNSNFEAIIRQSTEKLQLIEGPSVNNGRVNSLQLTGSGN